MYLFAGGSRMNRGKISFAEKFPELAKEAVGWDPKTISYGSRKKLSWKCSNGHIYQSSPNSRSYHRGCPICNGKQILKGFNDLETRYPKIARQAAGWDPSEVFPGNQSKRLWRCDLGHEYLETPDHRTQMNIGCHFCSGKKVLPGFNDLLTRYPSIASQANGWDPSKVMPGSNKRYSWVCENGHIWSDTPKSLTRQDGKATRCRVCFGHSICEGENDFASKYPNEAKMAHNWNPSKVIHNSSIKVHWKCKKGHIWSASPFDVGKKKHGCAVCSGDQIIAGVNDLETIYPLVAKEAVDWDPRMIAPHSNRRRKFRCHHCSHVFVSSVQYRTMSYPPSGCIKCSGGGYDKDFPGYFYYMKRNSECQIGITNVPFGNKGRLKTHERNGWKLVELIGPFDGKIIAKIEQQTKSMIKRNFGNIEGTTENWQKSRYNPKNIDEIFQMAKIEKPEGIELHRGTLPRNYVFFSIFKKIKRVLLKYI